MAQAGAVSPKMIAHFPKLLGVFVDRRWAKVRERTSKSVLHDGPHVHRGMRHGHTGNLSHLPNRCGMLDLNPLSQTDFFPMSKRAFCE